MLNAGGYARAGPCTVTIARVEQQIRRAAANPFEGPTAAQMVAAQLHHQPTPATVYAAEHNADRLAAAALERARKANAAGNLSACRQAVAELRDLYGIT